MTIERSEVTPSRPAVTSPQWPIHPCGLQLHKLPINKHTHTHNADKDSFLLRWAKHLRHHCLFTNITALSYCLWYIQGLIVCSLRFVSIDIYSLQTAPVICFNDKYMLHTQCNIFGETKQAPHSLGNLNGIWRNSVDTNKNRNHKAKQISYINTTLCLNMK